MSDRPYWCEICARKKECYGITLKPKCFVPMADRKTENSSEKPNNLSEKPTSSTISKMEQVDEPQIETKTETKNSNLTFEKDECAKEYEELGLKELKELIEADRKDEPSNSEKPNNCDTCRNKGFEGCEQPCLGCDCCGLYEPKDEPQTMLNDGTLVINVEDATKVSRVLVGDDKNRGDLYYPDDEDEPQTDCAWR